MRGQGDLQGWVFPLFPPSPRPGPVFLCAKAAYFIYYLPFTIYYWLLIIEKTEMTLWAVKRNCGLQYAAKQVYFGGD